MFVAKSSDNKEGVYLVSKNDRSDLVEQMKEVLSDNVKIYFKALGYHWNVKGVDFPEYHRLFGKIYEEVYDATDSIAENILFLGSDAPYMLSEFQSRSSIQDASVVNTPVSMMSDLLVSFETYLMCLNKALVLATMANEQGLINFLSGLIDSNQKWVWQLRSSLQS